MTEIILYVLTFGAVPLLFIVVGAVIVIKAIKKIYVKKNAGMKVWARCVDIQKIVEEGTTLYRPIFEYEYQGHVIRASRIDYGLGWNINMDETVPIYVDKKHPDVIVDEPDGNIAPEIVKIIMGVICVFSAVQFMGPLLLMFLISL